MDATEVFESERSRLFAIAYRLLGSVNDADDVVQDAWLRWEGADTTAIDNPAAWLTTVTSRLALDRLRSARHRREVYVGPWLPEPLATASRGDPAATVEMGESVMLGFLAVLERLGPVERAVFVLHDVFGLGYDEVAAVVDRTETNCRQIARRARDHVRAERPRIAPDEERDRRLLEAFLVAVAADEPDELSALLADDVVLISDGGSNRHAARRPVVSNHRVTRFARNLSHRLDDGMDVAHVAVNGSVALLVTSADGPELLLTVEPTADDRIGRIFAIRNPDKLERLVGG